MIKNTEWGAVAYLTYSKYGVNKKINVNNYKDSSTGTYKTGYSATEESNQTIWQSVVGTATSITQPYNTETGYKASTTGNISGLYDMAGGSIEYVAGYINGDYSSSGFNNESISLYNKKYFDIYKSGGNDESFYNRILGDATGEIGPYYKYTDANNQVRKVDTWYGEIAIFPFKDNSWIYRGGSNNDGIYAGMFMYYRTPGTNNGNAGSRMILAF